MIYKMSRELQALLRAKDFPVSVDYSPKPLPRGEHFTGLAIEISRDREASDAISPRPGAWKNPNAVRRRDMAVRCYIWARSSKGGAHIGNHEDVCEALVDAVICGLRSWYLAHVHADLLEFTEARYVGPHAVEPEYSDPVGSWPGVIYRLKFRVPRAVCDVDYAGEGLPEGSPSATSTTVEASINGEDFETVPVVIHGAED